MRGGRESPAGGFRTSVPGSEIEYQLLSPPVADQDTLKRGCAEIAVQLRAQIVAAGYQQ